MEFSICGVKIKLSYLFFVVILLGLVTKSDKVLFLILFSSLHELGHILALILFHKKPDEINLSIYGLGLKFSGHIDFYKEIIFLLIGVVINYIFAIFNIQREINLGLAILNSLPIYPLDMGRCLVIILDRVFDYTLSYKFCYIVSFIFLILLIVYTFYTKNINLLLIDIYLISWLLRGNL